MNKEKQQAAETVAHVLGAIVTGLLETYDWQVNAALDAYHAAGPWPTPITPPLEIGDADDGPTRDLLFGLQTALEAIVKEVSSEDSYQHANYATALLYQIIQFHPENDVKNYLESEVSRLGNARANPS